MNWRKDKRKKKAWQWDWTPDVVSTEQDCGLVEQTSVSHPRGRVFDPPVLHLFFFSCPFINSFCLFSFIYVVLFYLQHLPHYSFTRNYFLLHDTQRTFFFLISIFNELFKFKTSDEWEQWKTGCTALDWKGINLLLTQSQRSLCFLYRVGAIFRPEN